MAEGKTTGAARSPAEIYEELFVPALFRAWAPILANGAGVQSGQRVLDVACGTGALTRELPARVGPQGKVVGLDANPEMLAVARRVAPGIEWVNGRAEALPFEDASFDAVVSQFGLMFFEDRSAALREMTRVLRPGGRLAVAVWDRVERSPGYARLAALLEELCGAAVADTFRAPFVLGDEQRLRELFAAAGIGDARIGSHDGIVRFASLDALLRAELAWLRTVSGPLDDAQFERLLGRARPALQPFSAADGSLTFACPALIVTAARP